MQRRRAEIPDGSGGRSGPCQGRPDPRLEASEAFTFRGASAPRVPGVPGRLTLAARGGVPGAGPPWAHQLGARPSWYVERAGQQHAPRVSRTS